MLKIHDSQTKRVLKICKKCKFFIRKSNEQFGIFCERKGLYGVPDEQCPYELEHQVLIQTDERYIKYLKRLFGKNYKNHF